MNRKVSDLLIHAMVAALPSKSEITTLYMQTPINRQRAATTTRILVNGYLSPAGMTAYTREVTSLRRLYSDGPFESNEERSCEVWHHELIQGTDQLVKWGKMDDSANTMGLAKCPRALRTIERERERPEK